MFDFSALLEGDNFTPLKVKSLEGAKQLSIRSPGDIVHGRVLDSGSCSFHDISIECVVARVVDAIAELGVGVIDSVVIHVTYAYINQCNLEFTPHELDLVRSVNGHLTITCYQEDKQ